MLGRITLIRHDLKLYMTSAEAEGFMISANLSNKLATLTLELENALLEPHENSELVKVKYSKKRLWYIVTICHQQTGEFIKDCELAGSKMLEYVAFNCRSMVKCNE